MDHVGKAVIYKIINLTNAKFYVGSTINWRARVRTHRRKLNAGKHHCIPLQNAWNKYGEDAFVFKIVAEVEDQANLQMEEQRHLDDHHGTAACYNMARYTDSSSRGVVRSDKHRECLSAALKRHYAEHEHPRLGRPHTEESKALMRANRAGKPVSDETRAKLREANLGKTYSQETRDKLSAIRKGQVRSVEHAAKFNKAILEVTTGRVFQSLKEVKKEYGMSPGMLAKALAADRPLTKGRNAGKHFRYV